MADAPEKGSLLLVRHGQASFHDEDYDVLSDLGCEQGVRLGTWLARSGRKVTHIINGPLKRQRDTAAAVREGAGAADVVFPQASELDGWVEFPAIALLKRGVPVLAETDPELREMLDGLDDEPRSLAAFAEFEKVFVRAQQAWMAGELHFDDLETFPAFKLRVREALVQTFERVGEGCGVVVTSGGPIGFALQAALDLSDEMAMRMTAVVANSSMTNIRRRKNGYLVTAFNTLPHLRDASLITYR